MFFGIPFGQGEKCFFWRVDVKLRMGVCTYDDGDVVFIPETTYHLDVLALLRTYACT